MTNARRGSPLLRLTGSAMALISVACLLGACSAKSSHKTTTAADVGNTVGLTSPAALHVPSLHGAKIGIEGLSTQDSFSRDSYQGAIARVKQLGGVPIPVNAEQDPQKMAADIENLIAQKPAAIIVHGLQPQVIDPLFQKVRAAGIPLFTIDTPDQYSISNAEADNFSAGAQVAISLVEAMGGKGNLLVFNAFSKTLRILGIRYDELLEVLKDYPNIHILQPELQDVVQNTTEDARQKTQAALEKYPKGQISAIWAGWDPPAIGAAEAVDAAGRKEIHVFGFNGDPEAVSLIGQGSSFTATAGFRAFAIGEMAVDSAARYLAGQAVPPNTYVEPVLVTQQNLAQAQSALKAPLSASDSQ
jgi:ribose transport system substrate-binding protein